MNESINQFISCLNTRATSMLPVLRNLFRLDDQRVWVQFSEEPVFTRDSCTGRYC